MVGRGRVWSAWSWLAIGERKKLTGLRTEGGLSGSEEWGGFS